MLVIAEYDGMSLSKGGRGCYAKLATLAERTHTDVSNFSKAVSRLVKLGYVQKSRQDDNRRSTLRIIYGAEDNWRTDQLSPDRAGAEIVGELTNDRPEMVGELTNSSAEIVGDGVSETRRNPPKTTSHYTPLKGELDLVETKELNPSEEAQRENFAPRASADSTIDEGALETRKDGAEAPATGLSIYTHLPSRFFKLAEQSPDAALSLFEEAFAKIDRNADGLKRDERQIWTKWLFDVSDAYSGEPTGHRAERLNEEIMWF